MTTHHRTEVGGGVDPLLLMLPVDPWFYDLVKRDSSLKTLYHANGQTDELRRCKIFLNL